MVIIAEFMLLVAVFAVLSKSQEDVIPQEMNGKDNKEIESTEKSVSVMSDSEETYIKWVDFDVSYAALCKAYDLDVESYDKEVHLNWIELLAYVGTKSGGSFDKDSPLAIQKVARQLSEGETTIQELTKDMKYYPYYYEAYDAVLGGMVGEYSIQKKNESGEKIWKKMYGLKAFSPIALGFPYSDYDDFGSSRSYSYKRKHLGHDMMGQVGTPIRI